MHGTSKTMADKKEGQSEEKTEKSKKTDKPPPDPHRDYLDMDTDEEEFGRQETPEPEEELPPEPEKPVFTDKELQTLVQYVKDFTNLYALNESDWNEECYEVIREYFQDPTKIVLTVFYDLDILRAHLGFPQEAVDGLTYFLRSPWQVYTPENFHSTVIFGSISDNVENSILKVMENIYAPILLEHNEWPKTIKDDICSNMHELLINLTDKTFKLMGLTVLYIPRESLDVQQSKAPQENQFILLEEDEGEELDKLDNEEGELIGRLERVARYWIKQIREALVNTSAPSDLDNIMDEFTIWNYRYNNLSSLHCQLQNRNILCIVEKLENAKSASITQFRELVGNVQIAIDEATSNITYLSLLIEPCNNLRAPEGVDQHVSKILHLIRFIWLESPFYNSTENIETLCHALSSQITSQCREYIDLNLILDGDASKGKIMLETCISSCEKYKDIYDRLVSITPDIGPVRVWNVNRENVFNHVDAFVQRCRDVIEICDAMVVFGRCEQVKNFGGSKGIENEKYCLKIESSFYENLETIKDVCIEILDVTKPGWLECITAFRYEMTELETMVENLVDNIFKDVQSIEEGIEALYALQGFKQRQCLQEILHNKWVEVWKMFSKELENCKLMLIEEQDAYHPSMPYYSGRATMLHNKKNCLSEQYTMMINASDWLGDCDAQISIIQKYKKLIGAIRNDEEMIFQSWEKDVGEDDDFGRKLNEPLLRHCKSESGLIEVNMNVRLLEIMREAMIWADLKYEIKPSIRKFSTKWSTLKLRYDGAVSLCMSYNRIIQSLSKEELLLFAELLNDVNNVISVGFQKVTWNSEFIERFYNECSPEISNLQDFIHLYKRANAKIDELFESISNARFITVTDYSTYELEAFVSYMAKQWDRAITEMTKHYDAILELILGIREGFDAHLEEIIQYWRNYLEKMDRQMERSLILSVRCSLRLALTFFRGDGVSIPEPLIKIQADYTGNAVIFNPNINEIEDIVTHIHSSIAGTVQSLSEFSKRLDESIPSKQFREIIEQDEVCLDLQQEINGEMEQVKASVDEYWNSVDCFNEISEIDSQVIAKKYVDAVASLEILEADIQRCTKLVSSVQNVADEIRAHFVVIDVKRLKSAMIESCEGWREILCIELSKAIATEQKSNTITPTPSEDFSFYSTTTEDS